MSLLKNRIIDILFETFINVMNKIPELLNTINMIKQTTVIYLQVDEKETFCFFEY